MEFHRKLFLNHGIKYLLHLGIIFLAAPIIYYGFFNYQIRVKLGEDTNSDYISANRYLASGDWPASKDDNSLIKNYHNFMVKQDKKNIAKNSKIEAVDSDK